MIAPDESDTVPVTRPLSDWADAPIDKKHSRAATKQRTIASLGWGFSNLIKASSTLTDGFVLVILEFQGRLPRSGSISTPTIREFDPSLKYFDALTSSS
jgi:hypothetical protein